MYIWFLWQKTFYFLYSEIKLFLFVRTIAIFLVFVFAGKIWRISTQCWHKDIITVYLIKTFCPQTINNRNVERQRFLFFTFPLSILQLIEMDGCVYVLIIIFQSIDGLYQVWAGSGQFSIWIEFYIHLSRVGAGQLGSGYTGGEISVNVIMV